VHTAAVNWYTETGSCSYKVTSAVDLPLFKCCGKRFLRATAVPAGTAEARISYGNSVRPSVRPSRPGGIPSTGEIETPGLQHMVAWSI